MLDYSLFQNPNCASLVSDNHYRTKNLYRPIVPHQDFLSYQPGSVDLFTWCESEIPLPDFTLLQAQPEASGDVLHGRTSHGVSQADPLGFDTTLSYTTAFTDGTRTGRIPTTAQDLFGPNVGTWVDIPETTGQVSASAQAIPSSPPQIIQNPGSQFQHQYNSTPSSTNQVSDSVTQDLPAASSHQTTNSYQCTYSSCDKCPFHRLCDYKKHMSQHEKPHHCRESKCGRSFARPSDLARHERVVHQREDTFLCDEPGCKHALIAGAFHRKDNLEAHLRRKHPWLVEQLSVQNGNAEAWDSDGERAEAGPSTTKDKGKKKDFAAVEEADAHGGVG